MHRSERHLVWAVGAVLALCGLGAVSAAWPGDVGAHARAVVAHVLAPGPVRGALEVGGVGTATGAPGEPGAVTDVDVLSATVENGPRTIPVTVRYPSGAGRFPLVVVAHGFAASAETYADLEEQLARAGFVVVAPDFPHSSSASAEGLDRGDVVNQAGDVSAVVTTFLDRATAPPELRGRVLGGPVGVVGHSDGGITAAAVAYNSTVADPRVGAAVILSGAAIMYPGGWFTGDSPPLLAIHGDADAVNPWWSSEQLVTLAGGPRYLVTVLGGDHTSPYTTGAVEPAVGALAGDFLRAYLDADGAALDRLPDDASADGLTLTASG